MEYAGYSGTPLGKKLGIKEGCRLLPRYAPNEYLDWIAPLPGGVTVLKRRTKNVDIAHLFVSKRKELADELPLLIDAIEPDGTIWVSWHKKASRIPTEITEDVVREIALPLGLVDVKVCAVTDIWSGLKLVIRKELR